MKLPFESDPKISRLPRTSRVVAAVTIAKGVFSQLGIVIESETNDQSTNAVLYKLTVPECLKFDIDTELPEDRIQKIRQYIEDRPCKSSNDLIEIAKHLLRNVVGLSSFDKDTEWMLDDWESESKEFIKILVKVRKGEEFTLEDCNRSFDNYLKKLDSLAESIEEYKAV